jgi:hypothetical protein
LDFLFLDDEALEKSFRRRGGKEQNGPSGLSGQYQYFDIFIDILVLKKRRRWRKDQI